MQGDLMELFEQNVIQSYYKRNAVLKKIILLIFA